MTTIINNDSKESTLIINFDRDWKYIYLKTSSLNEEFISIDYNDSQWTTIDLPHNDIIDDSSIYWYRKKFEWRNKPDIQQHIYLNFYFNEDEDYNKIFSITAWLNENKIYLGNLPGPIELTKYLRIDLDNILVICSNEGHTLSIHARILMPRVCVGQINYDDVTEITPKKRRQILDYTASFNDADGLINIFIDSFQKLKKSYFT
jgi:hypothetical protein